MSTTFAEAASLTIRGNLDEIGEYTVRALLDENRRHARNADNESRRGDKRLADFIEDKFGDDYNTPKKFRLALRFMSDDLRNNVTPYGMIGN